MANQEINTEELMLLNNEILVRGIIEKTKSPGLRWSMLSPAVFQATANFGDGGDVWDFILVKTKATGNGDGYNFTLEITINDVLNNSIKENNALTNGGGDTRSTRVEELFITVERVTLEDEEKKLKDANQLMFLLANCRQ